MGNIGPAVPLLFLMSSCVDGFKDEVTCASKVMNAQLENPEVTVTSSADGTELIIGWSVVPGAGGYEVTVYNVDDPENPVPIGEEKQFVDGFEVRRPATEDTKFLVEVRTLDNKKMNNTGATAPVTKAYDNLLEVYQTIPAGTNLTDYFAANPAPSRDEELCYQLEAGGSYTMNGSISFGQTDVTIRGDKLEHAKIELTDGSFVSEGAKLKLQFLDIDANNFTGTTGSSGNALFLMSKTFPTEGLTENDYKIVPSLILQSCKVSGLPGYLFWDSGQKYAIANFMIKDCIVGHNTSTHNAALIRYQRGMVQNMTFTNTTFYNENPPADDNSQRFIQISSGNTGNVGGGWLKGSGVFTVTNCTFWQVSKNNKLGNSNGAFRTGTDKVIIQRNVFVDSGGNSNNMRELKFRNGGNFTGGQNSQWWNGEDLYTRAGSNESSNDVNPVNGDPGFSYLGNGQFQMTGAAHQAAGIGDPRWLNEQ